MGRKVRRLRGKGEKIGTKSPILDSSQILTFTILCLECGLSPSILIQKYTVWCIHLLWYPYVELVPVLVQLVHTFLIFLFIYLIFLQCGGVLIFALFLCFFEQQSNLSSCLKVVEWTRILRADEDPPRAADVSHLRERLSMSSPYLTSSRYWPSPCVWLQRLTFLPLCVWSLGQNGGNARHILLLCDALFVLLSGFLARKIPFTVIGWEWNTYCLQSTVLHSGQWLRKPRQMAERTEILGLGGGVTGSV